MEFTFRFPIDTPEVQPIRNTDELKAAVIENLSENIASMFPMHESEHPYSFYRVYQPVKGILQYGEFDEGPFAYWLRLYLDYGTNASDLACKHIWMNACQASDWSTCPPGTLDQAITGWYDRI